MHASTRHEAARLLLGRLLFAPGLLFALAATAGGCDCAHRALVMGEDGAPGLVDGTRTDGLVVADGALDAAGDMRRTEMRPDINFSAWGYIYVVDDAYRLLKFYPPLNKFSLIGNLSCPGYTGTPFSMSVDRDARAWVLYNDGMLYWVDTDDASCQTAPFPAGQANFDLFGMGFVADGPGSATDILYVAGHDGAWKPGLLGVMDPTTLYIMTLGQLPDADQSPELTGTGNGELYAYFPGKTTSFVALLDRKSAKAIKKWSLPKLESDATAWAFAHWGGRFYIFVSTNSYSRVLRLDPSTGKANQILSNVPYRIVGAGVSSLAPVKPPEAGILPDGSLP